MDQTMFAHAAQLSAALAERWYGPVSAAMREFDISTPARQAMFIAQIGHESAGFTRLVESFDYSVNGLTVFGARLSRGERTQLGRQPGEPNVPLARQQAIANRVYGGRLGNGEPETGDGWRYRGRGLKQITFADNYCACGQALGVDLLLHPEWLEQDDYAARSAGWFWHAHDLNRYADRGNFAGTTRLINGPAMEAELQREARWTQARQAMSV
ncbi:MULTISPECIES: glycoside hydrolase family 19 protein [unclassified Burkholderia]|uniref:glycoside hydrolase family 19 protein n=1 Tax=unclassified Burkholderia TaxID=2613784 RepID=UPI000756EAD8|nr:MULTISPECIES: glycoside hydrolase family 19 protein [unclassified Burkholderia]KVN20668.1 endolysin [Burkholderia sp. MSMB1552]KWZ47035.1 endolysin [Burkholderia sp. MSMB1588]